MGYEIIGQFGTIGVASVEKRGLFYYIYCQCFNQCTNTYSITITSDKGIFDIGICKYGENLECWIPIKRLGVEIKGIHAEIISSKKLGSLYEIDEFKNIEKLPLCYLQQLDTKMFIGFKVQEAEQQDSDQNP